MSSGSDLTYNVGNVGIGTTTPATPLEVNGIVRSTRSGVPAQYIQLHGGDSGSIKLTAQSTVGAEKSLFIQNLSGEAVTGANNSIQFQIGTTASPSTKMMIDANGNVGIGTTPTSERLIVRGPDTSVNTIAFEIDNSNGASGLAVFDNGTVRIGALDGSSPTLAHACFSGLLLFFAGCTSAAEYVPTIDDGAGFAEAADLVSIAPSVKNTYSDEHAPFVVTKSAKPCDDNLLGFIVNPESGADGKKLNEHYLPLAIYGYFPAKVTLENGAIKRGDPLTSSSKPGYGMKATQACKIFGYALEDAEQDGTIQVFAQHGENAAPEVAVLRTQVNTQAEQLAAQQKQIDALVTRLAALEHSVQSGVVPTLASR